MASQTHNVVWVNGPIIVGAGPSGLSVAASLKKQGVPYEILERAGCIASLWQRRTYDRLRLHLPKHFLELPGMPVPDDYPEHSTRRQYVDYLDTYAARFQIMPRFNTTVLSARHDETSGLWRLRTCSTDTGLDETEYICRWLVVATGEHAERDIPGLAGFAEFGGEVTHVADYNSGEPYHGKKVLVVGAGWGNAGVEVALDLCNHGARTAVVARDVSRVRLPRSVFGKPTLELAAALLKGYWRLPAWAADKAMEIIARTVLGDLAKLGLRRLADGPERESPFVRTPVFDCRALEHIRADDIAVVPPVARFGTGKVEFVDGQAFNIDVVMLTTGYRSSLPQATWHGRRNRYPAVAFPYGWNGYSGLYGVGFSRRGIHSATTDAVRVANEIAGAWRAWSAGTQPAAGNRHGMGVHIIF